MNKTIKSSELIINPDGTIFHLHLKPEDIADTILLVGDPGRCDLIASYFDEIELKKQNREFVTITGTYKGVRISTLATGIGTDNIDIVVNELDALVNIDLETRQEKTEKRSLNLIRLGTCGALQGDIPLNSLIASKTCLGFDGLLNFYEGGAELSDQAFEQAFIKHIDWNPRLTTPYVVSSNDALYNDIVTDSMVEGITISAPGFYGPQGRELRLPIQNQNINEKIASFRYKGRKITNYEMECSAIYGLSVMLGHNALTICTAIANRVILDSNPNYKDAIVNMVTTVLDRVAARK